MKRGCYTVSDVARLAGVTVRALHHYDEIGLLAPSGRSDAGYRLYSDADLRRLQQILMFRQLGFALDAIPRLLAEPALERRRALLEQRQALLEELRRNEATLRAIDRTLATMDGYQEEQEEEGGEIMDPKSLFDGFDPSQYEDEVKRRWGDSDAYKESTRRFKGYKKDDLARMQSEGTVIIEELVRLLKAGRPATSTEAMDAVERYRLYIDKWFYPCDRVHQTRLADLYVGDSRFGEYFEKHGKGLTQFVADAIRANASRP